MEGRERGEREEKRAGREVKDSSFRRREGKEKKVLSEGENVSTISGLHDNLLEFFGPHLSKVLLFSISGQKNEKVQQPADPLISISCFNEK